MRQDMIRLDIITRLAFRGRFKRKSAELYTRPCQTKGQRDKETGDRGEFLNYTNAIRPVLCMGHSLAYDSEAPPEQRLCSKASLLEG